MNEHKISFAQWNMRKQLKDLWQICFDDLDRPVNYFFNKYFEVWNCLVYLINDRVAAAVYLLPAQIVHNEDLLKAHYIYAAATLPEHRKNGYMSKLLNTAALVGKKRGDLYSFLLPANEKLYKFYESLSYMNYYKIKILTLSRKELSSIAYGGQKSHVQLTNRQITNLRNAQLFNQYGSVIWNTKSVSFALESNRLYGGRLISSKTGREFSYALVRSGENNICEIIEIVSDLSTLRDLCANILYYMPAEYYKLRLPAYNTLFNAEGDILNFGMIKQLNNYSDKELSQNAASAYLGLTLD